MSSPALSTKLKKVLAFDSDEINAIAKDIGLLKQLPNLTTKGQNGPHSIRKAKGA